VNPDFASFWSRLLARLAAAFERRVVSKQCHRTAFDKQAANANMRKRLIYKSVSGNPVLNGDSVELNFITDPVLSADDVTVQMSRSELERLHRRISDRLSQRKQS